MFFIDTLGTEGLGNRGYVCGGTDTALMVGPPRDIDRVLAPCAAFVSSTSRRLTSTTTPCPVVSNWPG